MTSKITFDLPTLLALMKDQAIRVGKPDLLEGMFVHSLVCWLISPQNSEFIYDLESTNIFHIEQDGGGEGGAGMCYTVLRIGDKYYKVFYTYHSFYGFNFDYAYAQEVMPREETIKVYD